MPIGKDTQNLPILIFFNFFNFNIFGEFFLNELLAFYLT